MKTEEWLFGSFEDGEVLPRKSTFRAHYNLTTKKEKKGISDFLKERNSFKAKREKRGCFEMIGNMFFGAYELGGLVSQEEVVHSSEILLFNEMLFFNEAF